MTVSDAYAYLTGVLEGWTQNKDLDFAVRSAATVALRNARKLRDEPRKNKGAA